MRRHAWRLCATDWWDSDPIAMMITRWFTSCEVAIDNVIAYDIILSHLHLSPDMIWYNIEVIWRSSRYRSRGERTPSFNASGITSSLYHDIEWHIDYRMIWQWLLYIERSAKSRDWHHTHHITHTVNDMRSAAVNANICDRDRKPIHVSSHTSSSCIRINAALHTTYTSILHYHACAVAYT